MRCCCCCRCSHANDETARLTTALIASAEDDFGPHEKEPEDKQPEDKQPEGVQALKDAVDWMGSHADDPVVRAMTIAYGSDPFCFERFLAARGHDVKAAAQMWLASTRWRRELSLHVPLSPEEEAALRERVGPHWPGSHCGLTLDGSPITYFRFGLLEPRELLSVSEEDLSRFYVDWMEQTLSRQNEANPPGTRGCEWRAMVEVYDFRGVGLRQLHLAGLRRLSRVLSLGQAHYPENARKIVMINVPRIFYRGWSIVSGVLDVRTREKVEIRHDDGTEHLRELAGEQNTLLRDAVLRTHEVIAGLTVTPDETRLAQEPGRSRPVRSA